MNRMKSEIAREAPQCTMVLNDIGCLGTYNIQKN